MNEPPVQDGYKDLGHGDPLPPQEHVEHDFTGPLTPPVARLLKVFGALCVLLFVLDFVVDRKTHAPGEGLPGFYPVYGFVGCVLLVLIAKEMRKVVMRDSDYYERRDRR